MTMFEERSPPVKACSGTPRAKGPLYGTAASAAARLAPPPEEQAAGSIHVGLVSTT